MTIPQDCWMLLLLKLLLHLLPCGPIYCLSLVNGSGILHQLYLMWRGKEEDGRWGGNGYSDHAVTFPDNDGRHPLRPPSCLSTFKSRVSSNQTRAMCPWRSDFVLRYCVAGECGGAATAV